MKELDHAHRGRLRGTAGLVLSMRFLGRALARLAGPIAAAECPSVPRPAAGATAITFVGHATVMLTTARTRILTDPLLRRSLLGLRRMKAAGIATEDLDDVRLVLISHAHRDHLDRPSLRRLSRRATIIVPPRCADLVVDLGFERVVELEPAESFDFEGTEIVAVPCRHSGTRGLGDWARRGTSGFVVRSDGASIYFAGDTGYFSGFQEIGRRFNPDVALLPIAGYEPAPFRRDHMSPLDAIYAFDDLAARVLIPIRHGSFPLSYEPIDAPLAWLRRLAQERRLIAAHGPRRIAALEHGETFLVRRSPAAPSPTTSPLGRT